MKETLAHHVARGSGRTGLLGGWFVAIAAMAAVQRLLAGAAFGAVATAADFVSSILPRTLRNTEAKRNDNRMLFLFEADR